MNMLQTFWVPVYLVCALEYGPEAYYDLTEDEIAMVEKFQAEHPGAYYEWCEESEEVPSEEFRDNSVVYPFGINCCRLALFA